MQREKIQQFRRSLRKFERDAALNSRSNPRTAGLSVVQCHTVINLGELKQTTIGQMAEHMGVDKSTLSRTVDSLVRLGLVERETDPEDRRFMRIFLSEKGEKICRDLNEVNNRYLEEVFAKIPKEEQENVLYYFDMFVRAVLDYQKKKM